MPPPYDRPYRTLFLTERVARTVRLAPADVAFLLARHRGHFELVPAGERHRYRLTALGVAGVLVAPGCRLVIRPKISLQNLFLLLDPTAPLDAAADASTPRPADEMLDFLAGQLAARMDERTAAGLHRGYREQAVQGPTLHGQLDLPAQMREAPGRKEQLHGRLDELTADVPCNQAVRATAERLLASGLLGDAARRALARSLRGFEGVSSVAPGPELFTRAQPDRLTEAYRPLLDLCRLLADGLAPGEQPGPFAGPAFLLDLERAFERYLTRGIEETFGTRAAAVAAAQAFHRIAPKQPGPPDIVLRPDITITAAGRPVLAVDAKWKRPPRTNLDIGDLHQAMAYGAALGVRRVVLVYPGRRDRAWTYPIRDAFDVQVRVVRVVGPGRDCRESLRRLGRALLRPAGE